METALHAGGGDEAGNRKGEEEGSNRPPRLLLPVDHHPSAEAISANQQPALGSNSLAMTGRGDDGASGRGSNATAAATSRCFGGGGEDGLWVR